MTTRIDKKQTRTHNKNTTQAETQKKGRARTKKTTNPKNARTRDKLDRKKVVCQTPNKTKTNMKQQRIPYSLKRESKNMKQKHVLWMKEIHHRIKKQ